MRSCKEAHLCAGHSLVAKATIHKHQGNVRAHRIGAEPSEKRLSQREEGRAQDFTNRPVYTRRRPEPTHLQIGKVDKLANAHLSFNDLSQ